MLKKMAMNKMNDVELTNVAGGTVKEFNEVFDAFGSQVGSLFKDVGAAARDVLDMLGPGGSAAKSAVILALSVPMEKVLKNDYNIDAYVSVGWGGTGFRSTHNRYSRDGKSLTHQEVLDIIRAA